MVAYYLVCWQTLKAARAMGDFLLVGIHSDQIVRLLLLPNLLSGFGVVYNVSFDVLAYML